LPRYFSYINFNWKGGDDMANYKGQADGLIRFLYAQGHSGAEIYRRLAEQYGGTAPLTQRSIYNILRRFSREDQERHTVSKLSAEAEAEMRKIIEAHKRIIQEMRKNANENRSG